METFQIFVMITTTDFSTTTMVFAQVALPALIPTSAYILLEKTSKILWQIIEQQTATQKYNQYIHHIHPIFFKQRDIFFFPFLLVKGQEIKLLVKKLNFIKSSIY